MDWLHEFQGALPDGTGGTRLCWDLMPDVWTAQPELLQPTGWENAPILQGTNVKAEYDRVTAGLDALLASYGYTRHGGYYTCRETCEKTIVCFCHFGITAVLLSHLWNVSPFAVLHGAFLAPSSVTVLNAEERQPGVAYFRCQTMGDTSHLLMGSEPGILLCLLRRAVSGLIHVDRLRDSSRITAGGVFLDFSASGAMIGDIP